MNRTGFSSLLSRSFVYPDPSFVRPRFSAPDAFDSRPICQFLQSAVPADFSLVTLFFSLEKDHATYPCLYTDARQVVLVPGRAPSHPFERAELVKSIFSHVLTAEQVQLAASGLSSLLCNNLKQWDIFLLYTAFAHFEAIFQNKAHYPSRSAAIPSLLSFFVPEMARIRLVVPVRLAEGTLPVSSRDDLTLVIESATQITVMSGDIRSWPAVTYNGDSSVRKNVITVMSNDTNELVRLEFDELVVSRTAVRNAL
jgi:hypothetical protein